MIENFYRRMLDVMKTSDNVFYRYYDEERTYGELYACLGRLNWALDGHLNERIAVYGAKGFPIYCGVFATLLSGNTWIPLNPDTPAARNANILKQAKPAIILADRILPDEMTNAMEGAETKIIRMDEVITAGESLEPGVPQVSKDDLSMIYFTSGSTGTPKGVMLTHENYILNVENIIRLMSLESPEVFADYHDLGFVISVPVLFPCVMTAGTLSPGLDQRDVFLPIEHMAKNHVSILITVPSTIARIRKGIRQGQTFDDLNVLVLCGEPLHLDILEFALKTMTPKAMYNFYGSTEVAPWIFYHRCSLDDLKEFESYGFSPVGKLIAGNDMHITDEDELWIAGPQITPGYLGGDGDEKFIEMDGKRWYRMGDKVVPHKDVYICKGRLDSQVKIGGYRVELMEVESHLRTLDGVDAAVSFVEGDGAEKVVVAVLVTPSDYSLQQVREYLKTRLPGHMLPRKVFCTANAPLNKSGKIDRAGIRETYES
jgi:acyl-coenzyme A synthetase/AMP-(fatty) acid ligase